MVCNPRFSERYWMCALKGPGGSDVDRGSAHGAGKHWADFESVRRHEQIEGILVNLVNLLDPDLIWFNIYNDMWCCPQTCFNCFLLGNTAVRGASTSQFFEECSSTQDEVGMVGRVDSLLIVCMMNYDGLIASVWQFHSGKDIAIFPALVFSTFHVWTNFELRGQAHATMARKGTRWSNIS